ncbi:minor capsid protein [Clostridium botulinum C/D]|uniref:minor capsid protein n=1 Tax=Clostridium botulinum TaxID=1491 RepID=UPI001E393E0E|nr:minor capsid protein [Clostridium botulinum]MCD3211809.1 minor capsid protein [Clostridium botulinum C/D]
MRNKDYWKKRSENLAKSQYKKTDAYNKRLIDEFSKLQFSIQRDIEVFYQRYSQNNKLSLEDVKKNLNTLELKELKFELKDFIKKSNDVNFDKELNSIYYKTRISRLECLQSQIKAKINSSFNEHHENTTELLKNLYQDNYHRNIYEIQKGLGIGFNFSRLNDRSVKNILMEPWNNDNYSNRIWTNKNKLISELQTGLFHSVVAGYDIKKTAKKIAERMNVAKNRAYVLVNTESSYMISKSTFDSYSEGGIEKYEILSTLDLRTSGVCREMDGKIFNLKDKSIGLNAPPFHPNCRTTIMPYFLDKDKDKERIAKDSKGNTFYIDGDMNYEDWYRKYIENKDKSNIKWRDFHGENRQFIDKKEISMHLMDNYNIKFSDSRKYPIHKDLLQDSIHWLDKFHNCFRGFKEIDPVKLPAFKIKAGIDSVGYYSYYPNKPEAVELVLNGLYFTDKNSNMKYIDSCIKSRWTVENAKGHKTFVHEYGHHVADSLKWLDKEDNKLSQDWCKEFIDSVMEDYSKKHGKNIEFKDISTLVSRYGGTKPVEAFAETFAEYFGGESPREFAQIFGEKVEERLNYHIRRKSNGTG